MHFGAFLLSNLRLPLPQNSCALQCILVHFAIQPPISLPHNSRALQCIFEIQRFSTPTPEITCIAMHFGAEMFAIQPKFPNHLLQED